MAARRPLTVASVFSFCSDVQWIFREKIDFRQTAVKVNQIRGSMVSILQLELQFFGCLPPHP